MKNKKIVFLGDSITECYNLEKFYPEFNVLNKGKSGDTTVDILNRLDESIFEVNPDVVILLIGANDLELLSSTSEEVIKNIKEIVKRIKGFNKAIDLYLLSVYPVNYPIKPFSVGKRTNKDINTINDAIKKIKEVTYIDVASTLKDENGELNKEYTYDGLHMSLRGYEVITEVLRKKIFGF